MSNTNRIALLPNAKAYIQLSRQQQGTNMNIDNLMSQLPRIVNQLTRMVGNDVVLKGLDPDVSLEDGGQTVKLSVSPGSFIQDSTLIEFDNSTNVELNDAGSMDPDGWIVAYIEFRYYQSSDLNPKLALTYIDQQGRSSFGWDHNKNRLVLDFYRFKKNGHDKLLDIYPDQERQYVVIHDKEFYRFGYHPDNITLTRYIRHFIDQIKEDQSPSAPDYLPDNTYVQGDFKIGDGLQVTGDIVQHGHSVTFDGTLKLNNDLRIADDVQAHGERFLVDSTDVQFGSKWMEINRNETGMGVTNGMKAGLKVDRGMLDPAILFFDESEDRWKIGIQGGEMKPIGGTDGDGEIGELFHTDINDWDQAFKTSLNDLTTTDLPEGDNRYYTEQRVFNDVYQFLRSGENINLAVHNNQLWVSSPTSYEDFNDAAHGDRGGGSLHSTATENLAGFLSASDQQKLNTVSFGANNYTHPETHSADIIQETNNRNFATTDQINRWESKPHVYISYGQPDSTFGLQGDLCIDVQERAHTLYEFDGTQWQTITQLNIGVDSNDSSSSNSLFHGDSTPNDSEGEQGDYYINTYNLYLYRKGSDSWSFIVDLNGAGDGSSSLTAAQIKTMYESNDDTNAFTNSEKDKLANIESNANNYTHPDSHNASIINQDSTHRFVTDSQISSWNSKMDGPFTDSIHGERSGGSLHNPVTTSVNGFMTASDKQKLDSIEEGANNYEHGDLPGGTLHDIATESTNGFLSSGDKSNLNTLWSKYQDGDFTTSTSVDILNDGTLVTSNLSKLNFIGDDVTAVYDSSSDRVDVYVGVPAAGYASPFNETSGTTDATVSDVSLTQRYIAAPTSEGNPFFIGDWTASSQHGATNSDTVTYSTNDVCVFDSDATTFTLTAYYPDGSIISTFTTNNITGDGTYSSNGFQVEITNWTTNYEKYQADVSIIFDLSTIVPNGGRLDLEMVHNNDSGTYSKRQNDIFYDANLSSPSPGTIDITSSLSSNKYLSGIRYFDIGDSFSINVSNIENLNNLTYPQPFIAIEGTDLGVDNLVELNSSDLDNWVNEYDAVCSINGKTVTIDKAGYRTISSEAQVMIGLRDWTSYQYHMSSNYSLLVDTYDPTSTDTHEDFKDEDHRLKSNWTQWDSTQLLSSTDLMIMNGKLQRQFGSWTTYLPDNVASYTANDDTQSYYRGFRHQDVSHTNGTFEIGGVTESDLNNNKIELWISLDGVEWWALHKEYLGYLNDGSGNRSNPDTVVLPQLEFTLGPNPTGSSTGPNGWGIYFKLNIPSGSAVEPTYIRLIDWI